MDFLVSEKPSGTFVQVRLLQNIKFKPNEGYRQIGEIVTVNAALAVEMSKRGEAAILYEGTPKIYVPGIARPS